MEHLNEYRELIRRFANSRTNSRIPNGLPQHASILVETMLFNATAEMRIYTKELNESVYGAPEVQAALRKFLSKPYSSLKILLQDHRDQSWVSKHPMLQICEDFRHKFGHGAVMVKTAVGSYSRGANHFTVMDNDGYRFETDHENCKAIANFNEPETAKKLIQVFDMAFGMPGTELTYELGVR